MPPAFLESPRVGGFPNESDKNTGAGHFVAQAAKKPSGEKRGGVRLGLQRFRWASPQKARIRHIVAFDTFAALAIREHAEIEQLIDQTKHGDSAATRLSNSSGILVDSNILVYHLLDCELYAGFL